MGDQSIQYFLIYTKGAGVYCQMMDIVIILVSICAFIAWKRASRIETADGELKREFLLRWPRLLFGIGITAALIGVAECVWGILGSFFTSNQPCLANLVKDVSIALVPLLHGGVAFLVAWCQYGIYRILLERLEAKGSF